MRKACNTFCGYWFRAGFYVPLQLVQALCVQHQSRQKQRSSLNFALIKNVSNYGNIIFSILRGLCFLTFLIQAKLSKLGNFNSSPTQNKVFFP